MENINVSKEIKEQSNPVFETAKFTAFQLAGAGDEDAKELISKLNFTVNSTQNSKDIKMPKEYLLSNYVIIEARFNTVTKLVIDSKCKTEVNIPCGYTPRAKKVVSHGIKYVGLDLPVLIEEAKDILMSVIDDKHKDMVRYEAVDATNYDSLKNALKGVEGPICITTEGLLPYFVDSEVEQMCDNIKRLLKEYGGCWIIADIENASQYVKSLIAMLGTFKAFLASIKLKNIVQQKSDVKIHNSYSNLTGLEFSVDKKFDEIEKKFNNLGFIVERISIFDVSPKLKSFDKLNEKQKKAINNAHKNVYYWKLTLDENYKSENSNINSSESANDIKYNVDSGTLYFNLINRIDSINAPNLLAIYNKAKSEGGYTSIVVDCKNMEYISSAGLRVLMIMYKENNKNVKVINLNDLVNDIFCQTGFTELLNK